MLNRKKFFYRSYVLIAVLAVILLINGCGKQSPVAPGVEQTGSLEPFGTHNIEGKWGKVFYYSLCDAAVGIVDEGGGKMKFNGLGYEAVFDIPKGAVDSWTFLSCEVTSYSTKSGLVYVFNFGPEGTVFNTPATLTIEMEALGYFNPGGEQYIGAEMNYWNPQTGKWELQEIDTDIDDGTIEFEINHFSRYSLGGRTL